MRKGNESRIEREFSPRVKPPPKREGEPKRRKPKGIKIRKCATKKRRKVTSSKKGKTTKNRE